jgi:hypothetical protein
MLFTTFVLVTIQCKHDGLQQRIDFCQTDETTQTSDVPGFTLKQEEKVSVLLHLAMIGIMSIA